MTPRELVRKERRSDDPEGYAPAIKWDVRGHLERAGLRKLGNPAGFEFARYEAIGGTGDVLLSGCVVTKLHTRGPKKGRPVFKKPYQRVVVTAAEFEAERARWEAETGHCGKCLGSGYIFASWNNLKGFSYGHCSDCNGSGEKVAA